MTGIKIFCADSAVFETYRSVGAGRQKICEWIGQEDGTPFQAGIAELTRIRLQDYTFAFDDFLFILDGSVKVFEGTQTETLGPGQALFISRGTTVTLEVSDRLLWVYAASITGTHWSEAANEPAALEEM